MHTNEPVHLDDIDHLNSFLRGEISALETYDQALAKVDQPDAERILRDCRASHERRVAVLRDQIRSAGGEPSDSSGAWGTFAKAVEGGAALFGESSAVSALATGEQHGLNDYRRDFDDLSPAGRQLVTGTLLPEQESTAGLVESLRSVV